MLYKVPKLGDVDRRVLDEIERMRHDLRMHVRPQERWTKQLRRSLTARAIVGSNTIEGYAASVDDVEALMAGEAPLETSDTTRRELEGYQRAMTYIQALSDAGDGFRYDLGLLNGLHFMMQEHHPRKRPGRIRGGPVYVTSPDDPAVAAYTGPDHGLLPGLMDELIQWLDQGDLDAPVHVRASMAHLNLVMIHPWADGNGRMSRALSTLVFAREALLPPEFSSIEEWLGRGQNTYAYYQVLQEVGGARLASRRRRVRVDPVLPARAPPTGAAGQTEGGTAGPGLVGADGGGSRGPPRRADRVRAAARVLAVASPADRLPAGRRAQPSAGRAGHQRAVPAEVAGAARAGTRPLLRGRARHGARLRRRPGVDATLCRPLPAMS
ncbi:Fic family protein [Nonomuraea ferruginea]